MFAGSGCGVVVVIVVGVCVVSYDMVVFLVCFNCVVVLSQATVFTLFRYSSHVRSAATGLELHGHLESRLLPLGGLPNQRAERHTTGLHSTLLCRLLL